MRAGATSRSAMGEGAFAAAWRALSDLRDRARPGLRALARITGLGPAASPGRRFQIRATGALYIVVTALLVVAAVNSQNNLLFLAFGVGIGGILLSGVVSGAGMMALRVTRGPLPRAIAGEPIPVRYTLENRSRWIPCFALSVHEPDAHENPSVAIVSCVPPGRRVAVTGVLPPRGRGVHRLDLLETASSFPIGIARKSVAVSQPAELVVEPKRVAVPENAFLRSIGADAPADARLKKDRDGEFFALREYTPGDAATRVLWKHSARLGVPVVADRASASVRRVWIVVRGLNPADPEATDRVLGAAASVYERLAARNAHVGLAIGRSLIAPGRGRSHHALVMRALASFDGSMSDPARLPGQSEPFITMAPHTFASRADIKVSLAEGAP